MTQTPAKSWKEAFGPLRPLLEDPSISEIMVNGPQKVFVEQKGLVKKTPIQFSNMQDLVTLMGLIAQAMGRKLDADNPYIDARLPDGSRVNCIIPPVAIDGPVMTIRRFPAQVPTMQDLVKNQSLDEKMAYLLHCAVVARLNILVSGGTGGGKTTLLNALSQSVPPHERLITIEDSAELRLKGENVVRLESRPVGGDWRPISSRDLLVNALRMRPDRILIGECRSSETLDMLNAMNTGHEGSMSTVHANSARDALRRVESMILISNPEVPLSVLRQNMSRALDIVIHVGRLNDGTRKVLEIIEVGGMEGDVVLTQDLFKYHPSKGFTSSGFVPRFVQKFPDKGIDFPKDFFTDAYQIRFKP